MLKGIFYTAISKYSGVIITIVITAILARLLTPAEFGVVALVTVFIGFFNLLGDLGIGPAIVQTRDLTKEDIESIFTFSAVMAFILALIFFLSGNMVSSFYEEPELIPLVRLLSISVFFNILSIVPRALNKKELRFKQMGMVTVGVQTLAGVLAIILAINGFSYYSIVFQNILTGFLLFALFYYLYPVAARFRINKAPLKRIAAFSTYQFAFNFINYFSRNLDNILIGKYLGPAALGFYNKSYTLMQLPVSNLTHVITPVLHPILAKHQNDKKIIYNSYKRVVKILAGIGFPVSVFLYFSASDLILVMFGPQWEMSVPVFKILALTVGIQVCLSSTGSIFQATGRTDLLFLTGALSAILMISGISYGVFIGESLEDVGYGLILAFTISFFQGFYLLINKALDESFISFLKIFIVPIFSAIVTVLAFYFMQYIIIENPIIQLVTNTLILLIILVLFFLSSHENRSFLKNMIKKRK